MLKRIVHRPEDTGSTVAGAQASTGPGPPSAGLPERPGARERAMMRRRLRRLRQIREALLIDLGALVFEMHRQDRQEIDLLQRKTAELSVVDEEARALAAALDADGTLAEIVNAGVAGTCGHCGALVSVDANFCSSCGAVAALGGGGLDVAKQQPGATVNGGEPGEVQHVQPEEARPEPAAPAEPEPEQAAAESSQAAGTDAEEPAAPPASEPAEPQESREPIPEGEPAAEVEHGVPPAEAAQPEPSDEPADIPPEPPWGRPPGPDEPNPGPAHSIQRSGRAAVEPQPGRGGPEHPAARALREGLVRGRRWLQERRESR